MARGKPTFTAAEFFVTVYNSDEKARLFNALKGTTCKAVVHDYDDYAITYRIVGFKLYMLAKLCC